MCMKALQNYYYKMDIIPLYAVSILQTRQTIWVQQDKFCAVTVNIKANWTIIKLQNKHITVFVHNEVFFN